MTGSYQRFTGKAGIVTGAGMGMGAAIARALAAEGAAVAAFDLDGAAAEKVAAEINSAGGRAIAVAGSVTSAADARRAVDEAVAAFGGLDLLVNNAGVVIYGEVPDYAEQDWDTVVGTNLKGQFLMCKYAIPRISQRGGGAIVNMASVQAVASQREVASYAASKGGVVSLTKSLALDHARNGIRVNCVLPGSVRTPMLRHAAELAEGDPEQTIETWGRIHPRGTVIEPEEIASVVLFLLSSDASAMTGSAVVADAGLTAQAAF
ncbi:MAG TPA: SDR family NAD(P)-dependent oxidoreductase [Trebonia sp.]|jgi:NAD(P)-dependent dehydrogenase (short-subunit alcohol dehydrogenase family)